ncbi:PAS domain S-box protein [Phormidium sp. LEGE 05292]|uniref:PAS domain S-box protein n=1 Tax=[Phormidium] sp. LEGE 05292 TaxID=767427 RepID=UPI00188119E4|nr:PAS domain S-box protein [Phormidium sp. LEGE 05292]MBE9224595.1 PAS domain S-box protein [Phormidium sp. LEGE 05292]
MSKNFQSGNSPAPEQQEIVNETLERLVAERTAALEEELFQLQAELRVRKERFEAFFSAMSQLVWVADVKGRVHDTVSWRAFTGQTEAEARGLGWLDAIHLDDRQIVVKLWQQAVATQSFYNAEYRLRSKDGTYRYFMAQGVPVLNEDGSIREIVGISTDVHERLATLRERKAAEDALKQSEERFRSLMEATAQVIWNTNAEGELINEQPTWSKFSGQTFAEYQSWGWLDIIHPDDRKYVANRWAKAVNERSLYEVEFRMRRHDGEYRYMSCRAVPILNPDRTIREWIGANTDITERQQAEAALRQKESQYRSIFESVKDGIGIYELESGNIIAANPAQAKIHGYTVEEFLKLAPGTFIHPDYYFLFPEFIKTVRAGKQFSCQAIDLCKDGTPIDVEVTAVPYWQDGKLYALSVVRDITESKQAEIALQQSEQRFRSLIEATAQIIWNTNAQGELFPNQSAWTNFTGQSFAEYKGWGWLDAIHPEDRAHTAKAWSTAVANRTPYQVEHRLRRYDGEYCYMSVRAVPILEANGSIREWIGVHTDIKERRQAEIALQQTEQRFRSLIEATAQIIWNTNAQGELFPNQSSWSNFTGQTFADYKDGGWAKVIHPEDLSRVAKAWSTAVANGTLFQDEFRIRRHDGEYRYMSVRGIPILDADGSVCEWIGASTDITERRQAEIALQQSEQRFRSLIEATTDIIWNTNAQGELFPNQFSWSNFTGQTFADYKGWGWLKAIHPDDHPYTSKIWLAAVANSTPYEVEYRVRRHDGEYRYMNTRAVPILEADGSVREWIGICADITERKKAEIALTKAKEAAETANRAKSEFLANMSHELRTPLNGIIGYAQILLRGRTLIEEDRSRIEVMYQCGSHLLTLINDILDLSKIEAQKMELLPTDFHFPAFLQGVAEMCRIRAELKGIQFYYQSATELPIGIHADEKRLRQVLINLLTNAIKFTDTGSVTFTVSFAAPGKIRFQVRDTGIGIASEKLEAIFLPFEQVSDARRQSEGTGLGLAISRELVGLMGSQIQVQSEVNVGSIFWFDVDLPEATEWIKTSQTDEQGQIIGIKGAQPIILVVDDKWENRSVINNLLSPIGFKVFEATSGQEAWQKILAHQPNLILTDLLMPKGDGFELIKRIRHSETFQDLKIIVSSASVFESDQYRSIEAGGNDFLPKPVMAKELLEKLQKYLQLQWIYEEKIALPATTLEHQELISPPAEELAILYELAMKGNFKRIIKQAHLLEEIDRKYTLFAKKLCQLAKGFQDREILALIQSFK